MPKFSVKVRRLVREDTVVKLESSTREHARAEASFEAMNIPQEMWDCYSAEYSADDDVEELPPEGPVVPFDVLRIVYDLANGNELDADECDTDEMRAEAERQEAALGLVCKLMGGWRC